MHYNSAWRVGVFVKKKVCHPKSLILNLISVIDQNGSLLATDELMNESQLTSEAYGRRVLDNLSSAVLLFDDELKLLYMNTAAEVLYESSARHMHSQSAKVLVCATERVTPQRLADSLASGQPFTERELTLPLLDGRLITVDCTVNPLLDDSHGLLVELQQIDRQLRISREEHLITQLKAAQDLVRGLAHEFKNPLGGLRGAAQLLEKELADPNLCEYTGIIIDEADRLKNLVNRMLGPNKLPTHSECNIHTLLERVRNLVQVEAGERLMITRDYDPSIPDVMVDQDGVIQALLNIMRNAARAVSDLDDGRISLRTRILRQFTIGHKHHRLVVHIGIQDNGPGIPEAIREKLFYPMVTASEGGVGLGLSIAQSMINRHGGLIEFKSEPGKTLFSVLLPVENPNAEK